MIDDVVVMVAGFLGEWVPPMKVAGVLLFLGNILVMNIGTYSSASKPGCWVHRVLHRRIAGSRGEMLWAHGPRSSTFRAVHFSAAVMLLLGALATSLWGFVILNFFGAVFAAVPARKVREALPRSLERVVVGLTKSRGGNVLLLAGIPLVGVGAALMQYTLDMPVAAQVVQLLGCWYLLIWYFALFAGYWSKEELLTLWVFFVSCILLALGAGLSGPHGYPFVVLELGAAAMEGFFLMQEAQYRRKRG